MEMCSYQIPEPGVRDLEISGIQDRFDEVSQRLQFTYSLQNLSTLKNGACCTV